MARKFLISRIALAVAMSGGMAALALPAPALAQKAPKVEFSKGFAAAAADLDKAVSEASSNPAASAAIAQARAAKTPEAKAAAGAQVDAALGGAKAKLAAAGAAATTSGDKLKLGELTRNVGVLSNDAAMQHRGLVMMLDSGLIQPANLGQIQYLAGVTAYQTGDYAGAVRYLKPAYDGNYRDPDGMIQQVLADAYKRTNNSGAALALVQQEIAAAKAGGGVPSETALRTALQAAYDAKQTASAVDLAAQLAQHYPTPGSWNSSIAVVRALTALPSRDNLDLMRLMARTNALQDKRDYLEYIENADPRRLPGETLKIIDAGTASGTLTSADVAEFRQIAQGRLSADRASLPSLERDASGGSATAATVVGAADAFLSYDQPAKAEALYRSALSKAGVDKDRTMLRLGIAQADQGKFAEAQKSFGQVGGTRAPIAKLWAAYAVSKAAPGQRAPVSAAAVQ